MTSNRHRDFRWVAAPNAPNRWQVRFWLGVAALLDRLLLRADVQGLAQLPASGPLILYYNHIHYADPVAIMVRLRNKRYVVPMAKAELEQTFFLGWAAGSYGTIFVKRGEPDIPALRAALAVLQAGYALLIAPEGTLSPNGKLIPAEKGLGLLVYRTQATLMPVGIWGTRAFPSSLKRLTRPIIHYRFGSPFRFHLPATIKRREAEALITDYAMRRLAQYLPVDMRGVYSDPPPKLSFVEEL